MNPYAGIGASLAGSQTPEHGAVARHHVAARQDGNNPGRTIEMFIDGEYSSDEGAAYAVSVVNVRSDTTVLALQCTAGPPEAEDEVCGPDAMTITVTQAPGMYSFMTVAETRTEGVDMTISLQESCAVASPTAATCSGDFNVAAAGTQTGYSVVTTYTGSAFTSNIHQVEVTGGVEKLPTSNATPTLSVRNIAWCLAGALGIAGFLAV